MSNTEMILLSTVLIGTFGVLCLVFGVAVSGLLAWLATGRESAYNRGYVDGRAKGYSDGYQEGEKEGYSDGACDAVRHMESPNDLAYTRAAQIISENFVINRNGEAAESEDEE